MNMTQNSSIKLSRGLSHLPSLPVLRAIYGLAFAFCLPLGWVVVQYLAGRSPFAPSQVDYLLYGYITFAAAFAFSMIGFAIGRREQAITDLALSDNLTGLYNTRYFQTRLEQEFERFSRYKTPVSLVQVDLDHFKLINDTWGHQAGDMILKEVSKVVLSNLRTGEIAARVGGEEICIIVCNSETDAAFKLSERLRNAIRARRFRWHSDEINITASFGVAGANESMLSMQELYEEADKALYVSKQKGRDMTSIYRSQKFKVA
jgi:diguanylate cyclase (GGDEF)-like protein